MNGFNAISIVIPVGQNDQSWRRLLKQLLLFGSEIEIILSACQKKPSDAVLAENVTWIQATQGRACQLNVGARKATRNILWFLHADTQFTKAISEVIKQELQTGIYGIGFFRLKFANDGPRKTYMNAWAANIRSRLFELPFGDQGLIMNKNIFETLRGFDDSLTLGEDLDFVIRAKAGNIALQEFPCELITSARRYKQHGWLSTTIRHIWLTWVLACQAKQRLVVN